MARSWTLVRILPDGDDSEFHVYRGERPAPICCAQHPHEELDAGEIVEVVGFKRDGEFRKEFVRLTFCAEHGEEWISGSSAALRKT